MKNGLLALSFLFLLWASAGMASMARQQSEGPASPRLVLFLVIDQGSYEYLERFGPALQGGLKMLLDRGVLFTDAHQDHAVTNTGPGHAALSSGRYPGRTGIVSNEWYDRALSEHQYCVEDEQSAVIPFRPGARTSGGRSPLNLTVTTLPDWIKQHSSQSKIFAASLKDRSAILLGGKSADAAYWLDTGSAQFVTSRYYRSSYPEWLNGFRRRGIPESYFGKTWDALPGSARLYSSMDIQLLDHGVFVHGFPHFFGGPALQPGSSFYAAFLNSPFVDDYLADFAQALIENEDLGSDDAVDYLGLSFSALDLVGHDFGPNSPEVLDTVLRLDRTLGRLLGFIDARIGLDRVGILLSSDHGVAPFPEYRRGRNRPASRTGLEESVCFQQAGLRLEKEFGPGPWFLEGAYLDYRTLGKYNLRRQDVEDALADWIGQCPSVQQVWTRTQIEKEDPRQGSEHFLQLYRHSFHPDRSPDLFVQFSEYHVNRISPGTGHGTPYPYDSHVPLIFALPGAAPKKVSRRVRTVDAAPTLAAWLGIPFPDDLDGIDLGQWVF